MKNINEPPTPVGKIISQTIAMPRETNGRIAQGRVATVAISSMSFLNPVSVGAVVGCYADVKALGTSSMTIAIEVWSSDDHQSEPCKVTEGEFVFVAIDGEGKTRQLPAS